MARASGTPEARAPGLASIPWGPMTTWARPAGGMLHDHEHVKGMLSKARGKVEEGLGKVTGNKREQVRGEARQVQGDAQDAIRKPKNRP
jgi:uncharacterized protein YjbJ (UPF0337 family)